MTADSDIMPGSVINANSDMTADSGVTTPGSGITADSDITVDRDI